MINPEIVCKGLTGSVLVILVGALWSLVVGHWIIGSVVLLGCIVGILFISSRYVFWWPRTTKHLPRILMLHSVNDRCVDAIAPNNSIRPAALETVICELKAAGYIFLTLQEALAHPQSKKRTMVLTFDDGYVDNYTELFPILKRQQIKATLFVTDRRSEAFLSDEQLREMVASGFIEVGGHTVSHGDLTKLSDKELKEELETNRKTLQTLTGQSICSFAYPCGFYGERERQAVCAAGYTYAVTTHKKAVVTGDSLQLPRQILPRGLSPLRMYIVTTRGRARL